MHVLLDVHVANNDQQSAVACCIASSHEDLREKTSISSRADPNSQSVVPNTVSPRTDLCLDIRSTTKIHSIQNIIPTIVDCWASKKTTPLSNVKNGQIHHNLRINFGIHHEILHECSIHHAVLSQLFIHDAVLKQFFVHRDLLAIFPKFQTFLIRHNLRITLPILPRER